MDLILINYSAIFDHLTDKIFAVASILNPEFHNIFIDVGSTLSSNASDVFDSSQVHREMLIEV